MTYNAVFVIESAESSGVRVEAQISQCSDDVSPNNHLGMETPCKHSDQTRDLINRLKQPCAFLSDNDPRPRLQ